MEGAVAPNVSSSSSVGVEERLEGAVASNVSSSSSVGVEERLEGAVAPNVSSSSSVGVGERLEGAIASNVSSSVGVEERLEGAVASNVSSSSSVGVEERLEGAVASNVSSSSSVGVEERLEGAVASNVSSSSSVGVEERMEVAGASIVSHDAETRGMDSAHQEPETSYVSEKDEEPELPSAVQDLIRRLEDTTAYAPTLHIRDPGFLEFFPESASLSTITGWRSKVRLRVLEAIALRIARYSYLSLNFSCEGDISRFTASEWEVLLRGCNGLQTMRVAALKWSSDAEVESLCLQLGRIVNSSEVKELEIEDLDCKMTARCFLNLASGLRGNYDSKLESLKLTNTRVDSSGMKHVVDMINGAPLLKTLHLGGQKCDVNDEYEETVGMLDDMDEETVGMLSQALIRSSSLKELRLSDVKWGAALSLKALAGDDGNRSIEILRLDYMDILGDCLRQLLTSDASLKAVNLCSIRMSYEEWHQLGEFIRDNAIAKRIFVSFELEHNARDNWRSIEALACAASSHVKEPMSFWLVAHSDHDFLLSLNLLVRVLRGEIKSFTSFGISGLPLVTLDSNQDRIGRILSMNGKTGETSVLQKLMIFRNENLSKGAWKKLLGCLLGCLRGNTSLTHLALHNSKLDEDAFRALIGYLRGNTSITHLDLKRSELNEDSFRDLMGLLQVNLTLQKIDVKGTSWETDGKAAQIKEALQQNQMRAVYMSVFREAKLEFGDAKAGRLFLCGSPRAGKTQLRQTLMRIVQGKSWLGNKWDKLWRTQGIEVEFLSNNDKSQISIWDLAGQEIFRTLQSVLFPQTSNFCVFLFVYSHFDENTSSDKKDSCFQRELEEWLRFITSSSRVTGHNRPQVLVVITHKDKTRFKSLTWIHPIVKDLTERFVKFVDLHPVQECFHVNARKKKQVIPLKNHIIEIFKKLLSEKSPQVPHLCSQLSSLLIKNTKENKSCPLWSSTKFYDFCASSLTQFIPFSSVHAVNHSRIMKSILSYLNDAGSIVSIPNLDCIIVDPNWLTNTLLGELVALGQDFQAEESGCSRKTMPSDLYTSMDGFVSESVFARLTEEFVSKQPHAEKIVDREVIENILINLDLCFKLKDTSEYFIPSFIPEHVSTEGQKHQEGAHVESMVWKTRVDTSKFVGIRIQCEDERTMSLTAAFFPCFQMFMRRKVILEMHVSKETVICSRHYLRLFLDGHEIHVEQDRSHSYVDVLMLCSKYKSREWALKYVMKHIVQELISFCASPKGCPGVALVLGVIQTICVEMLIPSHLRGAILIEDLKSKFIRSINDKLEDIPLDKSHLEKEDELFNYEHSWPLIKGHTTRVIFERARELLRESDVEIVVNEILQNRLQQLESLQQGLISVNDDLVHSHPEDENMASNSNFPDMKDFNRTSSRCLSGASTSVENRSTQLILSKIDMLEGNMGRRFDGVDEGLRSVESIVQRLDIKVGQILSLQQELHSTLSIFLSKVDRIIQYTQSLQQAIIPKRPYVTDDVGVFCRMSARLHVGTTVRLHLMCESVTGFHIVKDQQGLKIRLDQENGAWIRKTIEISLKVMYYVVKAGLDVTLGLGQAIPDWADLKSDIVKLDGISNRDRRAVLKGGESKELKEAWLRIQQTLAPINYSAIFKLYQVKYVRLELGGHAWVCEECMNKGRGLGI
ncbi:hypothetical protein MPTK1_5g20255 [Marchantia polymorpha subsp. ruderalis]